MCGTLQSVCRSGLLKASHGRPASIAGLAQGSPILLGQGKLQANPPCCPLAVFNHTL